MRTTIKTKTAGVIIIDSEYIGDKKANWTGQYNYHNHKVKVSHNKKSFSFDFWGSIMNPKIANDQENVFAFYCALSDGLSAKDSFEEFCGNLRYDEDSRTAERVYKACSKSLVKVERVFDCDLYDLINEIQDTYNC